MVVYNSKEWLRSVLLIHKSDTFRKLFPYMILLALISWGIAYWEIEHLNLSEKSWLRNIPYVHNLLGFALSLLLVFRTNTAYDRWWEARKQWGALTNTSRAFAVKLQSMLAANDHVSRQFFRKSIPLFSHALFGHLRSDYTTFMLDAAEHPEFNLEAAKNRPIHVADTMFNRVHQLFEQQKIEGQQLLMLDRNVEGFIDICGACERIKNTPIPYGYSSFLKKFIVAYVFTLPIGWVFSMGYFVVAAVPFVFYVLASLEVIAESVENPFGTDTDDLPIGQIAQNIQKIVLEIIAP